MEAVLRRAVRRLGRPYPETTDAALLDRLARARDPAAFGELLARHGAAVWAVCRRFARSDADAEDTFQATFLVLARDAGRVRKAASVGSWLHGVAARVGRKARVRGDRAPDPARLHPPPPPPDPTVALSWAEVRAALDEELARLPDGLRAPILLCYFDGLTQDEAAAELGWSPRAVKDRIARARDVLRSRLSRRGIELPAALAVPLLASAATAAPARLTSSLAAAAVAFARGRPPGSAIPPAAVALARTEGSVVLLLRLTVLVASAAGLLAAGTLAARGPSPDPPPVAAGQPTPAAKTEPAPGVVPVGNPQFRQVGWHSRVFFTDGGKTLVSAGEGAAVRFWDVETGKQLHEIVLEGNYHEAAFAPESGLLAVAGTHWPNGKDKDSEGALWLIDAPTRKLLRTVSLPGNSGSNSQKVCVSADGKRAFVEYEGDVRVIDTRSGEELMRHKGRINAGTLAVSADGKTVAFGRYDVYLWDWQSGEEPKKFTSVGGAGTETIGFAPDGKTLFVAAAGLVATYDTATGRQTGTLDLGANPWRWAFSPDGKSLAVAYHNSSRLTGPARAVAVWDPATGKEQARFPTGRSEATSPRWSADGTRLAAATDYRLWAWDVKTRKPLGPASPGHEAHISAFAFTPDGRLFTASDDHTVRSWDAATGKPGLELVQDSWVRDVAVSPDGSLVAGSALENDLRVWDAKTGAGRFKLLGNGRLGGTRRVRFTPDGKRLVAWGDDLYLRVWDTRNGKLLTEHRTLPDGFTEEKLNDPFSERALMGIDAAAISGDGSTFAYCYHKVVQVFDVETGKERLKFEADPNGVNTLALSPDGKRLAVAGRGGRTEVRLPDGGRRFSVANDHRLAVWDLGTQKTVWEATVPASSWAGDLRFTDDGTRVAGLVTEEDKTYTIRFRDAATGKDIGRVELPRRGGHFAFDRAGKRIAVSFWDTTAAVYDLETVLKPGAPKNE